MPDDFQAKIDSLVHETRGIVAVPSDACVIQSLAAQVLLARRDVARLDWLEKEKTDVEYRYGQGALGPGWAVWMDDAKTEKHATVRAALDAARNIQP